MFPRLEEDEFLMYGRHDLNTVLKFALVQGYTPEMFSLTHESKERKETVRFFRKPETHQVRIAPNLNALTVLHMRIPHVVSSKPRLILYCTLIS